MYENQNWYSTIKVFQFLMQNHLKCVFFFQITPWPALNHHFGSDQSPTATKVTYFHTQPLVCSCLILNRLQKNIMVKNIGNYALIPSLLFQFHAEMFFMLNVNTINKSSSELY